MTSCLSWVFRFLLPDSLFDMLGERFDDNESHGFFARPNIKDFQNRLVILAPVITGVNYGRDP